MVPTADYGDQEITTVCGINLCISKLEIWVRMIWIMKSPCFSVTEQNFLTAFVQVSKH